MIGVLSLSIEVVIKADWKSVHPHSGPLRCQCQIQLDKTAIPAGFSEAVNVIQGVSSDQIYLVGYLY